MGAGNGKSGRDFRECSFWRDARGELCRPDSPCRYFDDLWRICILNASQYHEFPLEIKSTMRPMTNGDTDTFQLPKWPLTLNPGMK